MKRILTIIIAIMGLSILTACSLPKDKEYNENNRFNFIYEQDYGVRSNVAIVEDTVTGEQYLIIGNASGFGITHLED